MMLKLSFGSLAWVAIFFATCVAASKGALKGLDTSDMPRSICGWPSLHTTGRFPPYTTRLAQRLLGFALNQSEADVVVDGVFTDVTTQQINDFQAAVGLEINGYLNIDTWPSLVATVSPLYAGATGVPVQALQDVLNASGFFVPITGVYDSVTAAALSSFQTQRGASITDGSVTDDQTWHLLTTQCNSSSTGGAFWFDAGWPQGAISTETFACLRNSSFEYAVVQCWREGSNGSLAADCVSNVANAWEAGFGAVDVYMYPYRARSPVDQARELLANLTEQGVRYGAVMIDLEGDDWNAYSHEQNQLYLLSLRKVFAEAGVPVTIYCGTQWNTYFGTNFTAFSDVPLIYAHYENVPSFYDYYYDAFGGWSEPSGKQFWDGVAPEIVCGLGLDWDWSPFPFWTKR
jgi:peptidoglycan hydrolase-like protein with peptidoglycan-binding domain